MDTKAQLSAMAKAKAYGIDTSLLDANLQRTPTERILVHEAALQTAMALQEAMSKKIKTNAPKNSSTASSK